MRPFNYVINSFIYPLAYLFLLDLVQNHLQNKF